MSREQCVRGNHEKSVAMGCTPNHRKLIAGALAPFEATGLLPVGITAQLLQQLKEDHADIDAAPKRLLTRAEVASIVQVSPRSVINWELSGKLKSVKVGGRAVRFHAEEVERLIQQVDDRPMEANHSMR